MKIVSDGLLVTNTNHLYIDAQNSPLYNEVHYQEWWGNGSHHYTNHHYYKGIDAGNADGHVIYYGVSKDHWTGETHLTGKHYNFNSLFKGGDHGNEIHGGSHADTLIGGQGADEIYGVGGKNVIYGVGGDNFLHGGTGNSTIFGGTGNDTVHTGGGSNTIVLSGGNNSVVLDAGSSDNIVISGNDADTFRLAGGGTTAIRNFTSSDAIVIEKLAYVDANVNYSAQLRWVEGEDDWTLHDRYNDRDLVGLDKTDAFDEAVEVTIITPNGSENVFTPKTATFEGLDLIA